MRFGCCISPEKYGEAVETGFDFAEFSEKGLSSMSERDFIKLCAVVDSGPIPVLACNSYCGDRPALVGKNYSAAETVRYAKMLCGRAARQGVKSLGSGVPSARQLPQNYDRSQADAQYREFLRLMTDAATQREAAGKF